jgi:uncharacterized protein YggE
MGKITVTGTAQREVCYDAIDLRITFQGRSKKTAEAVDIVMRQCEQLLRLITEMGVKIQDIRLEETSVGRRYDDTVISKSSGVTVTASRSVTLRLKFDMPFLNRLMDAIRALDLSVNFHCSYILLNREMLQSELLRQAVEDSRQKAELIAAATGQRVIGIDSMDYRDYCDCDPEEDERFIVEAIDLRAMDEAPPLSDQLACPLTRESKMVSIVWLIE